MAGHNQTTAANRALTVIKSMWMLTSADYCADEVGRPSRALTRIGKLATHPAACLVAVMRELG